MMHEIKDSPFENVIEEYPDCVVDFCILKSDEHCCGLDAHREAIAFAMRKFLGYPTGEGDEKQEDVEPWGNFDVQSASARQIDANAFLSLPEPVRVCVDGKSTTTYKKQTDGGEIPYWEAFLLPPDGIEYAGADFRKVNNVLFPTGAGSLTVYQWTTDWSDYFNDGREWWGTACFSVYDAAEDRYVVIMASATD